MVGKMSLKNQSTSETLSGLVAAAVIVKVATRSAEFVVPPGPGVVFSAKVPAAV